MRFILPIALLLFMSTARAEQGDAEDRALTESMMKQPISNLVKPAQPVPVAKTTDGNLEKPLEQLDDAATTKSDGNSQ